MSRYLFIALKRFGIIIVTVVIVLTIGAVAFVGICKDTQSGFKPVEKITDISEEASIINYYRPEDSTYLTYPEWYLVFNPQEYAEFIKTERPSHFPYFASIGQFWSGYCQVYGITNRHYKFNLEAHVVESVIGVSFTAEYLIKGLYENTVGRITEIVSGWPTEEDGYAAKIATDYGAFIPNDPWYAFPFVDALTGLWTQTDLWGQNIVRKWERKFSLSAEYTIKALYAKIIGGGTQATLGAAEAVVYAKVKNVSESIFNDPKIQNVAKINDDIYIISIPHYQGFTDTVPTLAAMGAEFIDIAGNDEILITVITPVDWQYDLPKGSELFSMPVLTNSGLKRVAIQAPVASLSNILNQLQKSDIKIEHLFDY